MTLRLLTSIAKESKEADIVVNVATADDLELTKVILDALKVPRKDGSLPILIHTRCA